MDELPRWNRLINELKDRPDKGDMATFVNKLTSKKENIERKAVEKNE